MFVSRIIILVLFVSFFSSCAEISFSDDATVDTGSQKSSYISDVTFSITGVEAYDIAGEDKEIYVAYKTSEELIVASASGDEIISNSTDLQTLNKDFIETLDTGLNMLQIPQLDLDISPNGKHVLLGYIKTVVEQYLPPRPICNPTPCVLCPIGEVCEPCVVCPPWDPLVETRLINKLCYIKKEVGDSYFDDPICYELNYTGLSLGSPEEIAPQLLNDAGKKIIAKISNNGELNVFASGIKQFAYVDNRGDLDEFIKEETPFSIVSSMDMDKKTGETVVSSVEMESMVLWGCGGPVLIKEVEKVNLEPILIREPSEPVIEPVIEPLPPISCGTTSIRFVFKVSLYEGDKWTTYTPEINFDINDFNEMSVAIEHNDDGFIQILVAPYGPSGAELIEIKKEGETFLLKKHLSRILDGLNVVNMSTLIDKENFFVPMCIMKVIPPPPGSKMQTQIIEECYELKYDRESWIIPEGLLSSESIVFNPSSIKRFLLFTRHMNALEELEIHQEDRTIKPKLGGFDLEGIPVPFDDLLSEPVYSIKAERTMNRFVVGALGENKVLILKAYHNK